MRWPRRFKFGPILASICFACAPAEERFVRTILQNYEYDGLIHSSILQTTCSGKTAAIHLPYPQVIQASREEALEICRDKLTRHLLDIRLEYDFRHQIAAPFQPAITLGDALLRRARADFAPILRFMYIAREENDADGAVRITARLYRAGLFDEIIAQPLNTTYALAPYIKPMR